MGCGLLVLLLLVTSVKLNVGDLTGSRGKDDYGIAECEAPNGNWWTRWFRGYTSGTIQTHLYGRSNYASKSQCEWRICVPTGKVVRLTFVGDFWVEGRPGRCEQDKIIVSDGEKVGYPRLVAVCGQGRQQRPSAVTSSGNCVNVLFTADEALYGAGFRATFSAVSPGTGSRRPAHPALPSDGSTSSSINLPGCGNRLLEARIMQGADSRRGEWPWLVHMRLHINSTYFQQCGGNIINHWWVLTAAHCLEHQGLQVTDPNRISLWFGEHNKRIHEGSEYLMAVDTIVIHSERDSAVAGENNLKGMHDIALLKVRHPIRFTKHVNSVCLPTHRNYFRIGTTCYVAGWGKELHNKDLSNKLKHIDMVLVPRWECSEHFGYQFTTDDLVCATRPGTLSSPCSGDSGGPLACQDNGRFTLAGVVSLIMYCGQHTGTTPGLFTSTEYYMNWITGVLSNN